MKLQNYTYISNKGTNERTLLLLHDVRGDENDMTQIGQLLDPDASRISPKGKVAVDGYARYFTRLADASFDSNEVTKETDDLSRFIIATNQQHNTLTDKLVAIGYSNGANMIASLLAKHPGLIKKAILFRGMLPIDFSEHPDLNDVDVLLVNGEGDSIMDKSRVEQLKVFLTEHGANVSFHWVAAGHQLASEDIAIAKRWLAAHSD
jgi:phospholipase/carboxylesterase